MSKPWLRRPLTADTTRTSRQVPRDRPKAPLCRTKLLAFVLVLLVNSQPSAPNCSAFSPGFRRLKRRTKSISLGDFDSPVADFEVDKDAVNFKNCHCKNPDHGQGAFASSWCAGSEQD